MLKKVTAYALLIIVASGFIYIGHAKVRDIKTEQDNQAFYRAMVEKLGKKESSQLEIDGVMTNVGENMKFTAIIKSGDKKGTKIECFQYFDSTLIFTPPAVRTGDKIVVSETLNPTTEKKEWIFVDRDRTGLLIGLTLIFLLSILLIGKLKGIATILSLIYTVLAVFMIYIPGILHGYNVYKLTIITVCFIALLTIPLVNGFNKKALVGILGNLGGVLLAGILAFVMNDLLFISGFLDPDYALLTTLDSGVSLDLRAIVWGGIVIGALGAIMDISVSLASALNELAQEMQEPTFRKMLKAGMNIGTDAIGTMTNTLILAYIGSSLAVVLLLTAYNKNPLLLFNMEMISVEILQAVIGSLGIILAVPLTAVFGSYIFIVKSGKNGKRNAESEASSETGSV